jgi:hypothetical protein
VEQNYYEGDFLFGNCTSDFSFPPPIMSWYINDQKADANLLQPFQETTFDAYGFKLYQRSLEIRFRIDRRGSSSPFIGDGKVHMKCVSQIRQLPTQIRESNHIFFVSSLDDLRNQKLINWKSNSGERTHFLHYYLAEATSRLLEMGCVIIVFMLITIVIIRKSFQEFNYARTHTHTLGTFTDDDDNNNNDDDKKMFYIAN